MGFSVLPKSISIAFKHRFQGAIVKYAIVENYRLHNGDPVDLLVTAPAATLNFSVYRHGTLTRP